MKHKYKMYILTVIFGPFVYLAYGKWKKWILYDLLIVLIYYSPLIFLFEPKIKFLDYFINFTYILIYFVILYILLDIKKIESIREKEAENLKNNTEKSRQKINRLIEEVKKNRESNSD